MLQIIFLILAFSSLAHAESSSQIIKASPPLTLTNGQMGIPAANSTTDGYLPHGVYNTLPTTAGSPGQVWSMNGSTPSWNAACFSSWGSITGTLSNQGDLINAINAKVSGFNPVLTGTINTPLTANKVVVTDSGNNLIASSTNSSALATFISAASPTFTGTVTMPTGAGVLQSSSGGVVSSNTVSLTSQVSGTLPIGSGGTGQATANASLNALLPSQTSQNGNFLTTNGTNSSWASISGSLAKTDLSNLSSTTSINQNLLFATDNTYTIGDDTASSGVGSSRPSVIDTARVNSPAICMGQNSNTPSACLVKASTNLGLNLGGTQLYTFAPSSFSIGIAPGNKLDVTLSGDLQFVSQQKVAATTGGSSSVNTQTEVIMLHSATTLGSYTIILPSSPGDGQTLIITADAAVTSLTITPNSGQTIVPTYTSLAVNSPIRLMWENQYGEWVAW